MERCIADLKGLLEDCWDQIASMKEESEGRIKVSAAFLISFKGNEQAVKTTLTFGRRVSESRESIVNPDQSELPLNGDAPVEQVEATAPPRKTRRRASQEA
jgi:hypothetical protein